ncbi:MAG: 50S ribosomal protein L18 [Veillonella sp.]|nr:50S ribosomal protein L18 [Veillonella sp.]
MKHANFDRKLQRKYRHKRTTKNLKAAENAKPRLVVSKTDKHIYAQIIDDANNKVLCSSSTLVLKLNGCNVENAKKVGEDVAKKAVALKITTIAFDRGGNLYHGKVKALADEARKNGLKF